MLVRTNARYTPQLLQANPDFLFVFGDNLMRQGKGGQAAIRDEPNAVGLATKARPSTDGHAYFTNDCQGVIEHDVEKILTLAQTHMVVIPFTDCVELGTGLAELPTRAPKLYAILAKTFTADMPRAAIEY